VLAHHLCPLCASPGSGNCNQNKAAASEDVRLIKNYSVIKLPVVHGELAAVYQKLAAVHKLRNCHVRSMKSPNFPLLFQKQCCWSSLPESH
jgi:hypothetical protein